MVELAMTLVVIAAMVVGFQTVPRGQGAAADLSAQGRIDAVANAVYNAWQPGIDLADLDIGALAAHTSTPMTSAAIWDPAATPDESTARRRERVSVAFGQGTQAGYYGLAALGRPGTCWYLRGRIGTTASATVTVTNSIDLQNAWHSFSDFTRTVDGRTEFDEAGATVSCTGQVALELADGGPSWQRFTFQSFGAPEEPAQPPGQPAE
jgi:hypothetical protein